MPIGENVGRAYVSIFVDGTQVPDGIRDVLEDAEPSVREAGEQHGRTYGDAFDKEVKKSYKGQFKSLQKDMFEDLNDNLTTSLARLELSDRFFKSPKWAEFRRRLSDEAGAAGDLAGARLEKEFRDSANLESLAERMRNIGPAIRKAQSDILGEMLDDAHRLNRKFDSDRLRDQAAMLTEAYAMNKAFNDRVLNLRRQMDEDFDRRHQKNLDAEKSMLDEAYRMNKEHNDRLRLLMGRMDFEFERSTRLRKQYVDETRDSFAALREQVDAVSKGTGEGDRQGMLRYLASLDNYMRRIDQTADGDSLRVWGNDVRSIRRDIDRLTPSLSKASSDIDRFGDGVGRALGKGSRNNFLNFFGGVAGGLIKMTRAIPEGLAAVTRLGRGMSTAFDLAGGGGKGLLAAIQTGLGGVGGGLLAVTKASAGFVGFLAFLTIAIGPVVGLLSGLLGVVTALVSSLAFALVGAIAVAGGALAVFALGIGAVVAGFATMDDAQKKALKSAFKPVIADAKELAEVLRTNMFRNIEEQGQRFSTVLDGLRPLARGLGRAISNVADNWLDMLNSQGFSDFKKNLTDFLPDAVESLGNSFGNILGGLGGTFTALQPSIDKFLGWLEDATERFSEFANSPKGQNKIKEFFEDAVESAEKVAGFLDEVGDYLGRLFEKGKDSGDNIFDRMGKKIEKWTEYLEEHPDAVEKWFGNAEETAGKIGEVVDGLLELIDALDRAETRVQGNTFLGALGFGFSVLAGQAVAVEESFGFIYTISEKILEVQGALGNLGWYIIGGEWADDLIDGLLNWGGWSSISENIKGKFGDFDLGDVLFGSLPVDVPAGFNGLVERIKTALGGFNLKAPDPARFLAVLGSLPVRAQQVATQVVNFFSGLGGRIGSKITLADMTKPFTGLLGAVTTIPSKIIGYFASLGSKVAAKYPLSDLIKPFTGIVGSVTGIPQQIADLFIGLAAKIINAIGPIVIHPTVDWPDLTPPSGTKAGGGGRPTARGGLFNYAQTRLIGEAGAEAVVPLNRPLSEVDPAVRALSAFAQGMNLPGGGGSGRTVDASGWVIQTPSEDPRAVAAEVLDALVASTL